MWKKKLRAIKEELDLSWEELARRLGVSNGTLRGWLYAGVSPSRKSRRKIEKLEKLISLRRKE